MDRKLAIGTITFAVLTVVFGLAVQVLMDLAGLGSPVFGQVGTFLVATPLALLAARRLGRITHVSVLLASAAVALASLWAIVFILNSIAAPAGGHASWASLFNSMNWRNTVFGTVAALICPQLWLWLLNRLAANNSFKPKPLRSGNGVAG